VIKQRIQIQQKSKDGKYLLNSFTAFRSILQDNGLKGLYKGYWAGIATYGPFVGIYFACYEQFKRIYREIYSTKHDKEMSFVARMCSGALSGAIASAITNPLDIVKTRLQVESSSNKDAYKNIWDALTRITREEGLRAFTKGIGARIMWIAPGTALTISAYEQIKYFFS